MELARQRVADLVGASPQEIYFTSCGTESDNWAIWGAVMAARYDWEGGREGCLAGAAASTSTQGGDNKVRHVHGGPAPLELVLTDLKLKQPRELGEVQVLVCCRVDPVSMSLFNGGRQC